MPEQKIKLVNNIYTTRRYIGLWLSIWLALLFVTWYSRPLIPYQETFWAAVSWEGFFNKSYLYPLLNGEYSVNTFPLIPWIEIGIWQIIGVSEFSLRALNSLFSLGVLFLVGWAAYQLWPDERQVRGNAPFILVGSVVWTLFATANISEVWLTFFLVLSFNFFIRVWRFRAPIWWLGFIVSSSLGLLASGVIYLVLLISPLAFLPFFVAKQERRALYRGLVFATTIALLPFLYWALKVYQTVGGLYNFGHIIGGYGLWESIHSSKPSYLIFLNIAVLFFPWIYWFKLYRMGGLFRQGLGRDNFELRFLLTWSGVTFLSLILLGMTSLMELLPLYPPFCLIVAKALAHNSFNKAKDISLITLVVAVIGALFIIIPLKPALFLLPEWTSEVSLLWGVGLLFFALTLFLNAHSARIFTLMLMSVALTLAINFGVVQQAGDFYDLSPAGERISWYQSRGIEVAHWGSYPGHLHFVGRIEKPLTTLSATREYDIFASLYPNARLVAYLNEISDPLKHEVEYWQPFRGRFLVIAPIAVLRDILNQS